MAPQGKLFKTNPINRENIEATLKFLSPIVGIPYKTEKDSKGNVIRLGLEDSTLGSAAKTNAGIFGKKDIVGDIDIAIDEKQIDFDRLVSRLVQKLGPENVDRPRFGQGVIPTKVPVAGDSELGYVQVDFMFGNPELLKFTYNSPDPESNSKYKGVYRNILMSAILQSMRRQVRDPETQEVIALVGPSLLLNKGIVQQWRHFPLRKDGKGRLTTMKAISRNEFDELYPKHKGREKEFTLTSPKEIINFIFPGSSAKPEDIDSFEKLRDLVIKYKPEQAEDIFNRFITSLQKHGYEVPDGLVVESFSELSKSQILREVRELSLQMVAESIAKENNFEDFRSSCLSLLDALKEIDHFKKPKINADLVPQEGLTFLLNKCSLLDDWKKIRNTDYETNHHYRTNDCYKLYKEFIELLGSNDFFFVANQFDLKITPESFLVSLIDMG